MDLLYVIAGPTASGKTAVAVELAKKIGGEVISADSMQVYRGMDIGTAKPTPEEMSGVRHHLLDIIAPDEAFSAAEFQARAVEAISEIKSRGAVPIVAGGTGFYINALLYGTEFSNNPREEELRGEFIALAEKNGAAFLHNLLEEKDPAYAATLHANNVKRVARALAYIEATGNLFSSYNTAQKIKTPLFDARFFILNLPREILYARINARTQAMFEAGFVAEVQNLQNRYNGGLAAIAGIGYKEVIQLNDGRLTLDETIALAAQATRNYAKRQETWFRNQVRGAVYIQARDKTPAQIAEEILQTPLKKRERE